MPIYEYRCEECGATFELLQTGGVKRAPAACTRCGAKKTTRLFSRFGFTSGSVTRTSSGGGGCGSCRPSPGQCSTCGGG